jgi:hypothetical protein
MLIIFNGYWILKIKRSKAFVSNDIGSENAQEGSYLVAELTAQKRKSHSW